MIEKLVTTWNSPIKILKFPSYYLGDSPMLIQYRSSVKQFKCYLTEQQQYDKKKKNVCKTLAIETQDCPKTLNTDAVVFAAFYFNII